MDNPQAFPMIRDMTNRQDWDYESGMTLRDYFAGQVLAGGLVENEMSIRQAAKYLGVEESEYDWKIHDPQLSAKLAYSFADAMLKARKEAQ